MLSFLLSFAFLGGILYSTATLMFYGLDQTNKGNESAAQIVGMATSVTFYFFFNLGEYLISHTFYLMEFIEVCN